MQNPEAEIDEANRLNRFFDKSDPFVLKEVFPSKVQRIHALNQILDYSSEQTIMKAKYPENIEVAEKRVQEVIRQIGHKFSGTVNPRKFVYILVTHGFFVDAVSHVYAKNYKGGDFCCTHLLQTAEDMKSTEAIKVVELGMYGYK